MKIISTIFIAITAMVYLAACTTMFEDNIHPVYTIMITQDDNGFTPRGFLQCDDYLTNDPSQNYCSKSVPEDWQGFKFNDEQFYKVPLLSAKEGQLEMLSDKQQSQEYHSSEE